MKRSSLAYFWLPALVGLTAVAYAAVVPDLPAQVAIHWGSGGRPDGFVDAGTLPLVVALTILPAGAVVAAAAWSMRSSIAGGALIRGLPLGTVSFLATLMMLLTARQIGATQPAALPGWVIGAAFGAGLVGGIVGALLASGPNVPRTDAPASQDVRRVSLEPTATAVFSERTPPAPALPILAVANTILGLGLAWFVDWWLLVIFLPVTLLLTAAGTFDVTVGPTGVDVRGQVLGYPRVRVPLSEIEAVEAGTVNAYSFGGWGIRGGLGGESAVITRSGPALVVRRTDGATLRVSLDQPERAVAVLATLMDRRR